MAKAKRGRPIDGLIILDKPTGQTSNFWLQRVKHLLQAAKAGHTGSLDPLASGVLPLCFGESTKVSQFLLDSDKTYITRLLLGTTTATGDSEGEVLTTCPVPEFTLAEIAEVLRSFEGVITQSPSIYSALKQNGVPLYKLAREGKEIQAKFRDITIHHIRLLKWESPHLELEVCCSKGTYIRTLAEDIGKKLAVGAHVVMLRRTKAGPFTLQHSHTFEQLQQMAQDGTLEACLLPADLAIAELPAVELSAEQTLCLRQGKQVSLPGAGISGEVRVYRGDEFIGVGEFREGSILVAKRLVSYTASSNNSEAP